MSKERKILKQGYTRMVNQILDQYDSYSGEDKGKVKKMFENLANLEESLRSYDTKKSVKIFRPTNFMTAVKKFFE